MNASIYTDILTHWDDARHDAAGWFHRQPAQPPYHQEQPQEDTMQIAELHRLVDEGIGNIEGWASSLKAALPAIAAKASALDNSPVVRELEALGSAVLPPEIEASIVSLIQFAGKAAAQAAAVNSPQDAPAEQAQVAS